MKLNLANTSKVGKPCRIFDATGEEVLYCIECDTETGEVEQLAHGRNGFVLTNFGTEVERIKATRPAPLTVEWLVIT